MKTRLALFIVLASLSLYAQIPPYQINPGTDGQSLCTVGGVTTWGACGGSSFDPASPGPIGATTPNTVNATSVTAQSVNGEYNAVLAPGSDIGAKINYICTTFASLNPKILVPASSAPYSFSTPLIATATCSIWGQGRASTNLQYTGSSSVAEQGYSLHDLTLSSTTGHTGVLLNSPLTLIENSIIGGVGTGFALGMTVGSNAYLYKVSHTQIAGNTQAFYFPGSVTASNSGENVVFDHVTFSNCGTYTNGVQIGDLGYDGPQVTFYSPSFDACQWANYDSSVTMTSPTLRPWSPSVGLTESPVPATLLGIRPTPLRSTTRSFSATRQ